MSQAAIFIKGTDSRATALKLVRQAPLGTLLQLKPSTRTLEQNAKMWAMLTEISEQATLRGQKWTPDQWKAIFMQALGHEIEVLPTLNGSTWFPCGQASSQLTVGQMSELIESITAWGVQNGVKFQDDAA